MNAYDLYKVSSCLASNATPFTVSMEDICISTLSV